MNAITTYEQLELRASELEKEVIERKKAEEALREAQADLEKRFKERTNQLVVVNEKLRKEIQECRKTDEALRESEERFRVLVEESPLGVSIISSDGRYKYLSPKFLEIFGYNLEDIPTGRKWFTKAFPDKVYRNEVISTWIRDFGTSKAGDYRIRTFNVTCNDGSEKTIRFTPVIMESGDQFVIYEDITERKLLEAQLQQAQKMEALGTLAGGIAHNFNNLLMGIMGNSSLMLLDTAPTDPNYEKLQTIEKLVDSGSKLTRQLLGYAREGRYELNPINLNQVVKETSDTFGITKKEITIHHDLTEDLLSIRADHGQIEQALWNLYINAADAMPRGGDLFLQTTNVTNKDMTGKPYEARPGNYVSLIVTDTGTGMDKKTIDRIFDPFFTTKEFSKGTGLGLASVYGIIKAHCGYIDVESKKGRGTTFRIYLPALQTEVKKALKSFKEISEGTGNILLADDEVMVLDVGAKMLKKLGYAVFKAKGGKDAIEIFRKNKDAIDLVILDMIMPEMDGFEAYDKMKVIKPNVKVLLSSGYGIDGQSKEFLADGFNGFIQKPFNMEQLSQKVGEILDLK